MKIEDPINIMIDLEKEFNLFDIKVRDLKIWYFCRQEVNYRINSSINSSVNSSKKIKKGERQFKASIKNNLKKTLLYLKSLRWGTNDYEETDILCLSNNNMRREIEDGKEFDIIFDYIGKYLKGTSYSILNTFSGKQFTKNFYTEKCYNLTNYCLNIYLYKSYYNIVLRKEEVQYIREFFHDVEKYILEKYKLDINITETVLRNTAALIKSYKYAHSVLKKTKPKVLYVECAYSNLHLPFIYGAKSIGIKVVEFQHGVISNKHLGYLFNDTTPKKDPIPDYICVYGSYARKLLEDMNSNLNIELIEYGYPYLNEKSIEVQNNSRNKRYKYLVTTQGTVNYRYWRRFIKDLLEEDKNARILVKLHPNEINQYKDYYSNLLNNNRVEFTTDKNVYECLKLSEIHLSSFSTCHYEAICCNIDTIVVMFPGWEHVNVLKKYGVKFVDSPLELINYLNKEKCGILFNKFKKDFFNIENSELNTINIGKKISNINKHFLQG